MLLQLDQSDLLEDVLRMKEVEHGGISSFILLQTMYSGNTGVRASRKVLNQGLDMCPSDGSEAQLFVIWSKIGSRI